MASFKLAALLLKQLTKPVAKRIEGKMAESPWFKERCVGFAQSVNRISVRFARNLSGDAKQDAVVLPLSENRAVQYGASLISEGVVFSVAGSLIVYEYGRKARSEEHKKLQEEARRISVGTALAEMHEEISLLRLSIARHGIKVGVTHIHHEQSEEAPQVEPSSSLGDWWDWASGAKREAEQKKLEKRKEEMHARQLEAENLAKKHEQAMTKRIAKQQEQSNQAAKIKESDELMRAESGFSGKSKEGILTSKHTAVAMEGALEATAETAKTASAKVAAETAKTAAAKVAAETTKTASAKVAAETAKTASAKVATETAKTASAKLAVAATKIAAPSLAHTASCPAMSRTPCDPDESLKAREVLMTNNNDGTLAISVASSLVVVGLVVASLCTSKPR